jgi:hypothetical protein
MTKPGTDEQVRHLLREVRRDLDKGRTIADGLRPASRLRPASTTVPSSGAGSRSCSHAGEVIWSAKGRSALPR